MRMRKVLPTLALAGTMTAGTLFLTQHASAGVDININLGDSRYSGFRTGLVDYFGVRQDQVLQLNRGGLSGYEVPIALYIARHARIEPGYVLDLRERGMGWHEITRHFDLSPDIFYVSGQEYAGPYARIYDLPRSRWDEVYLSDEDYVNLANLKFMTDHYGYSPDRVMRLRSEGQDFFAIANLIGNLVNTSQNDYRYGNSYDDSLDTGDVLGAFFTAALNHFGSREQDIYSIYDRGLSEREIPVALYLARQTGVSPMEIADLRASGYSWSDITYRYGLNSEVFYVPLSGNNYGSYASYYRQPRTRWSNLRLDDNAVIDLVNLRFMSDYYRTEPDRIVQLRSSGQDFTQIARQFHRPERNGQIRPWTHRRQVSAAEARRQMQRNGQQREVRQVTQPRREVRKDVTEQRREIRLPNERREQVVRPQPVPRSQNRAARAQQNQERREAQAEQREVRKGVRKGDKAQQKADKAQQKSERKGKERKEHGKHGKQD